MKWTIKTTLRFGGNVITNYDNFLDFLKAKSSLESILTGKITCNSVSFFSKGKTDIVVIPENITGFSLSEKKEWRDYVEDLIYYLST